MKKSTKLIGTAMAIMLMGSVVGCSNDGDGKVSKEEKTKTEQVVKSEKTDEELAKAIAKADKSLFTEVAEKDLNKEESKLLPIYKNATEVNHMMGNLFSILPQKGKFKVRYITAVQEKGDVIKVYLRKVDAKEKGSEFMLAKVNVKEFDPAKHQVIFMDAEKNEPIKLVEEKAEKKDADEKAQKATVETDKEGAKGSVEAEKKEEEKSSDKKEDKK